MPKKEISISFTPDQILLYELSLSIGRSLDPHTVCHDFLKTLFSRKSLSEASVWWLEDGPCSELVLIDALPADPHREHRLPVAHPYCQVILSGDSRIVSVGAPDFAEFSATAGKDVPTGACALFPLRGQGLLVIHAPSPDLLSPFRLTPINELTDRLAVSILGSFAYARLLQSDIAHRLEIPPPASASPQISHSDAQPLLNALIKALPDLVWLKDPEGVYLACNNRFERFFGSRESEIVGRTDYDFIDKDLADFFRQKDRVAIESGRPMVNEEWITFADDGHTELLETTKTPMYDVVGTLIGVLGIGHNVTERKQAEEHSRAGEERAQQLASMLRLMCDNVPDMIWAKDLNKKYLFANKALCTTLLGARDVKEPLGKTDLYFALREREEHPTRTDWHTFGELCQDSDTITIERNEPSVFIEFGNVKGKHLCLEVHKSPFVSADGKVIGTVGSARDITDRQKIEAELKEHRQHLEKLVQQRTNELLETETRASIILQSTADGLYGVDLEGKITFVNRAACKMLGVTEEEAIGQSAHQLFHHHREDGTPYSIEDCPVHEALIRGEEARSASEVYWHRDGHAIPVMFALHPTYQHGKNVGAVVSFVDITDQRTAEQAREQALTAAENLARAKSQFLANMSHEIRTPLNGILGFAQIGLRYSQDPDKARNAFDKILASGNRLLGVVNDVLDFSKIEAGKLSIKHGTVTLDELITHAVELVTERAQAKKLELSVEKSISLPAKCTTDGLRLGQVLLNLLTNAIKFTDTGKVHLSAWREENNLFFRVTDTGIGIAEVELKQIFDPFHQVDASSTRRFEGTGLGLAISRHILGLLGGSIRARSLMGRGSEFEFQIPYIPAAIPSPDSKPQATAEGLKPLAGLSILVAEDDPISAVMLEHNLIEDGAAIVMTNNGAEAVERVRRNGGDSFDIVLMDVQMPNMDGYEATRRIVELAPDLPVIGQSAHVFGDEKDKCFASGMRDHVSKPIDFTELIDVILKHTK